MSRGRMFASAMQTNRRRFEDSVTKGYVDGEATNLSKQSMFMNDILNLKNGETIHLSNPDVREADEKWDRDIGRISSVILDPDYGRALGSVKMKSLGGVTATRKGNIVEIEGDVYHTFIDKYDFNDDTYMDKFLFKDYRRLAEQDRAKPFNVYGSKAQKLKGRMTIENGRVTDPHFEWQDMD